MHSNPLIRVYLPASVVFDSIHKRLILLTGNVLFYQSFFVKYWNNYIGVAALSGMWNERNHAEIRGRNVVADSAHQTTDPAARNLQQPATFYLNLLTGRGVEKSPGTRAVKMKVFSDKSVAHESTAWSMARSSLKFTAGYISSGREKQTVLRRKKLTVAAPNVSQLLKSALKAVNVHGLQ